MNDPTLEAGLSPNLYREPRRTGRPTLPALAEIARAAIAEPQLQDALQILTDGARQVIGAHYGVLSETSGADWRQAVRAESRSEEEEYDGLWSDGAAWERGSLYVRVCETNRPQRLNEAQLRAHPSHPPIRSWLAAPLVSRAGENLGVIQLCDKLDEAEFDEEDEAALVLLAQFAAAAIKRAQARRDEVLALEALNALQESVQRELAERTRAESALSKSERRLSAVLENATVAVFLMNDRQQCVYMNTAAERLTGYTRVETQGATLHSLVHHTRPDGRPYPLEECPIDGAYPTNSQVQGEEIFVHRDGSFFPVAFTASPIHDESAKAVGTILEVRDIRAAKQAEAALRASEARFRLMADSAPVLIWTADANRERTWVNRAWLEFTGGTLEEQLGFRWAQNVHFEDLDQCVATYTRHFDAREPFRMEFRLRRHDGEYRWLAETAIPLFEGPDRSFSGYIGSCVDITEFKQAALDREQLLQSERAARGDAERLGRMKDEFLATLSHELRTPLNAMLGWATLLRRLPADSPDHTKGLETIERNARVQAQIIDDLLDMSRIISGKVQLDVQSINLADVVTAAIDSIRPAVDAKRLRLRSTIDPKLSPIRADPQRLQQILWNLLTNAVKFNSPGGRIEVVVERVSSHVEIAIEDTGIGLKPEFLSFIFDRFRQVDSSTRRRHGGLGLGLAIVKHLVELHGGSVRAKSPGEGQGSTFIVNLPISVARTDEKVWAERRPLADVDLSTLEMPSLVGITALVVDDERDACVLVCSLIEERGGRAIAASSGPEALEILARERIDILVSDIGMPDFDGYELIQRVRALEGGVSSGRIPAIALTAYARADDRQRALLAGYQMHVAKPVEARELVAGMASLLNVQRR